MLDLRVKTCCFTGHRMIPSGEKETIRNLLETAVEKAIQDGYRFFRTGGAKYSQTKNHSMLEANAFSFPNRPLSSSFAAGISIRMPLFM